MEKRLQIEVGVSNWGKEISNQGRVDKSNQNNDTLFP